MARAQGHPLEGRSVSLNVFYAPSQDVVGRTVESLPRCHVLASDCRRRHDMVCLLIQGARLFRPPR